MIACMGGFCSQRERCAHYHAVSRTVSERLCERGKEEPVALERAVDNSRGLPPGADPKRWASWIAGAPTVRYVALPVPRE